jgi:hypothetical protein
MKRDRLAPCGCSRAPTQLEETPPGQPSVALCRRSSETRVSTFPPHPPNRLLTAKPISRCALAVPRVLSRAFPAEGRWPRPEPRTDVPSRVRKPLTHSVRDCPRALSIPVSTTPARRPAPFEPRTDPEGWEGTGRAVGCRCARRPFSYCLEVRESSSGHGRTGTTEQPYHPMGRECVSAVRASPAAHTVRRARNLSNRYMLWCPAKCRYSIWYSMDHRPPTSHPQC